MAKRERTGVMLCQPIDLARVNTFKRIIIQPKLDGVRCRAIYTRDGIKLFSSTMRELNLPYIVKDIEHTFGPVSESRLGMFIDGELYIHGEEFEKITSIVSRTVNMSSTCVEYHIFDMVAQNEGPSIAPYTPLWKRLEILESFHLSEEHLRSVATVICDRDFQEHISTFANVFQNNGYEGIVVKDADSMYIPRKDIHWMKYKPSRSDTYLIVGAIEEINKNGFPKDRLGALVVKDSDGKTFKVGSGLTEEQRIELWRDAEKVVGRKVKVKYFGLTANGIPRHPVFVEVL